MILDTLAMKGEMNFIELFSDFIDANSVEELSLPVRLRLVVTFVALLDLVKNQLIALRQHEAFDEIILFKP